MKNPLKRLKNWYFYNYENYVEEKKEEEYEKIWFVGRLKDQVFIIIGLQNLKKL